MAHNGFVIFGQPYQQINGKRVAVHGKSFVVFNLVIVPELSPILDENEEM